VAFEATSAETVATIVYLDVIDFLIALVFYDKADTSKVDVK
jgi:hypothetical protein